MKPNKSSRDWTYRVKDILHAIEKIEKNTKDLTFADFKKHEFTIDGVIRNFMVIGEACNAIPLDIQNANSHIPWKQIIGLRNMLIHEYFRVDVNAI